MLENMTKHGNKKNHLQAPDSVKDMTLGLFLLTSLMFFLKMLVSTAAGPLIILAKQFALATLL
jgi:hypothetical protein